MITSLSLNKILKVEKNISFVKEYANWSILFYWSIFFLF